METIVREGSNRIVKIYKERVYKIPKDEEAVFQNKSEAYIWNETNHKYLCKCEISGGVFLYMDRVLNDVCKNKEGVIVEGLPNDFINLLKKHPKLEYGISKDGTPKIYDYADCEFDWNRNNPEDMFIDDLALCGGNSL